MKTIKFTKTHTEETITFRKKMFTLKARVIELNGVNLPTVTIIDNKNVNTTFQLPDNEVFEHKVSDPSSVKFGGDDCTIEYEIIDFKAKSIKIEWNKKKNNLKNPMI